MWSENNRGQLANVGAVTFSHCCLRTKHEHVCLCPSSEINDRMTPRLRLIAQQSQDFSIPCKAT